MDSSLWPPRTVPKLPSGTNGCQTLKTATLNTFYFCQKRPLCQPPPSPTPPPYSHFVRKVKLRLAYRLAFVIDQWKHSSTTRIYQDTCTLTQGRMAYSTSCSAVSREAWHLGQHHLSIKILWFLGEAKNQPFLKGFSYWYLCIFQGQLHFQFHLAMIWPQLPRSLPLQEVRGRFVACGQAWGFHRLGPHWRHGVRKLQPCDGMLDEPGDCWSLPFSTYATYTAHTRQHILEGYHQIFRLSSIQSLHQQQQHHHHNHQ